MKIRYLILAALISVSISGCGVLKKSTPYKMSIKQLESCEIAKESIGEIKSFGWFPTGNISTENDTGKASFAIKVKGSKNHALLKTELVKESGKWKFTSAFLYLPDKTKLDLLKANEELEISNIFFSKEKAGKPINNPIFTKGQNVFYNINTIGFKPREDGQYEFAADLIVADPSGKIILDNKNLINHTDLLENGELFVFFTIELPKETPSGKYQAKAIIYDKVMGAQKETLNEFTIK